MVLEAASSQLARSSLQLPWTLVSGEPRRSVGRCQWWLPQCPENKTKNKRKRNKQTKPDKQKNQCPVHNKYSVHCIYSGHSFNCAAYCPVGIYLCVTWWGSGRDINQVACTYHDQSQGWARDPGWPIRIAIPLLQWLVDGCACDPSWLIRGFLRVPWFTPELTERKVFVLGRGWWGERRGEEGTPRQEDVRLELLAPIFPSFWEETFLLYGALGSRQNFTLRLSEYEQAT